MHKHNKYAGGGKTKASKQALCFYFVVKIWGKKEQETKSLMRPLAVQNMYTCRASEYAHQRISRGKLHSSRTFEYANVSRHKKP